jgi:hypothetical protein
VADLIVELSECQLNSIGLSIWRKPFHSVVVQILDDHQALTSRMGMIFSHLKMHSANSGMRIFHPAALCMSRV